MKKLGARGSWMFVANSMSHTFTSSLSEKKMLLKCLPFLCHAINHSINLCTCQWLSSLVGTRMDTHTQEQTWSTQEKQWAGQLSISTGNSLRNKDMWPVKAKKTPWLGISYLLHAQNDIRSLTCPSYSLLMEITFRILLF